MSISVLHLTKKGYTSSGRIKIEGKPRGAGEGTKGLTLEQLREAFKHYELHRKYCDMDYKLPETCKDYFIKHNHIFKYDLILGKSESYAKALLNREQTELFSGAPFIILRNRIINILYFSTLIGRLRQVSSQMTLVFGKSEWLKSKLNFRNKWTSSNSQF